MKLGKVQSNLSFKRELTEKELRDYTQVLSEAKSKIAKGGKSIFIVHEPCLPEASSTDTGVGHLSSNTSSLFFDYIKNYMGINTVEVLPPGEIYIKTSGFYNTYNGSALSLGTQGINLELLTTPKFNSILPKKEFLKVVAKNSESQKPGFANYENIIGKDSQHEKALRIAFDNFKADKSIDKTAFENYKTENEDVLDKKAIYQILKEKNSGKKWTEWKNETERDLYVGVNEKKQKLINSIKKSKRKEIEFYKFKQFIADEHLKIGRENLNQKGMKLFGDCLIGFSEDEVWAYRDAFKKDKNKIVNVGPPIWKLPALDYDTILENGSPANELLKKKVEFFAKRYDGIRFDCSWAYVSPKLSDNSKFDFKGKILNIIENTVEKVKGDKFDKNDLIHEFEAGKDDFSIFEEDKKIKPFLRNRMKVITSAYLSDEYGTTEAMAKAGVPIDSYVIGVGNHDPHPLRLLADGVLEKINGRDSYRKNGQTDVLREIFKLKHDSIEKPTDFVKYKFAEPMSAKNNMIFYMDAFGRSERFDSQEYNGWANYRYRIPADYKNQYQKAVKSGYGFNPMDALARVFMKKNMDNSDSSLFAKIVKYAKILTE